MAQIVKLKRSSVAGSIPTTSNLDVGEIAINTTDGKIYFERGSDTSIQAILTTNTSSPITGSLNMSGSMIVSGTLAVTGATTLSSTLAVTGNATFDTDTLFVDAANNRVGIGTTEPLYKTHIVGSDRVLAIQGAGSSANSLLRFLGGATARYSIGFNVPTTNSFIIYDDTNSAYRMHIANGGGVSFGTYAGANDAPANGMIISGNVGIGTTSPLATLDVYGNISNKAIATFKQGHASNAGYISIDSPSDSDTRPTFINTLRGGNLYWSTGLGYGDSSNGYNISTTDLGSGITGTKLYVKSDGNVGIGTTSPLATLDVYGNISNKAIATFKQGHASNAGYISIDSPSDSDTRPTFINTLRGGNLYWSTGLGYGDSSNGYNISTTDLGSGITGTKLYVKSDGNVGIGTVAPNYKLEVSTDSAGKPGASGLWTVVSSEKIKKNIVAANLDRCYEIVKTLPLKHFGFKDGVYTDKQINDKNNLGWIAEDVQKVFKNAVSVRPFTLYPEIPDGFEEVEENIFIEIEKEVEKKEIKFVDGKYREIITKEIQKNKEQIFEEFDLFDENEKIIGKHKVAKKETVKKAKFRKEVIEDCLDLNSGQIYAAMYGAIQSLMAKVELLESKND